MIIKQATAQETTILPPQAHNTAEIRKSRPLSGCLSVRQIDHVFPTGTSLNISRSVMQIERIRASSSPIDTKQCAIVLSI
jgi:hypothetical protein